MPYRRPLAPSRDRSSGASLLHGPWPEGLVSLQSGRAAETPALLAFGAANGVGAVVVFNYLTFLSESLGRGVVDPGVQVANFAGFVVATGILGYLYGKRVLAPVRRWVDEEREPDTEERRATLLVPRRLMAGAFLIWLWLPPTSAR